MSKIEIDPQKGREAATVLVLIASFVIPLAIGLMFGAGVGWLTLGLFFIAAAYRLLEVARRVEAEKKRGGKNEDNDVVNQ